MSPGQSEDWNPVIKPEEVRLHEIGALWREVDANTIGRVLKAHLIVESFIDEHLRSRNPNLGDFSKLGFYRKARLIAPDTAIVGFLLPSILHLNSLRNRYAHDLRHVLSEGDVQPLLDDEFFVPYLPYYKKAVKIDVHTPIDIVEAFSQFVCVMLRFGTILEAKSEEARTMLRESEARFAGAERVLEKWRKALGDDNDPGNPLDPEENQSAPE